MTFHRYLLFGIVPLLLSLVHASNVSASLSIPSLLPHLDPGTEIFYPSNANWSETIQRFNTYGEPTFSAALRPIDIEDVQTIVRFAAAHKIPFLASSGGHGFTSSFEALKSGLEIDMSSFKNISVDADANKMTVGGGITFADIFQPLYAAGKEIQTGSCPCVGMLGATLGGGVGRYQGIHGLIIDALESVKIVTATGDLVTASKTQEPDLFWALRGAGFNFGIVVEATYTIYDLTNNGSVLNADFKFSPGVNATYFEIMRRFTDSQPAELSLYTLMFVDPELGPVIQLNAVYAGPKEEGLKLLQPLLDLPVLEKNITQVTWDALAASAAFGESAGSCVPGTRSQYSGLGIAEWDVPTHMKVFDQWINLVQNYPAANSSIYWIEFFPNQAIIAVPDKETAYPHRNIRAHVEFILGYNDASVAHRVEKFGTSSVSAFDATSGFPHMEVYVSYAGGTESLDAMYGERKLGRLLDLKKKWDPAGLFVFNNPLPVRKGDYGNGNHGGHHYA